MPQSLLDHVERGREGLGFSLLLPNTAELWRRLVPENQETSPSYVTALAGVTIFQLFEYNEWQCKANCCRSRE
jgi:hypothetical protein